jgi:farnesol dehydrogenase
MINMFSYAANRQVNVGGLENVLKAVKRTPAVKKIVYTSSYFAIGPTDGYVADEKQVVIY